MKYIIINCDKAILTQKLSLIGTKIIVKIISNL